MLDALRRGSGLEIKGTSKRGNPTSDKYSLAGISQIVKRAEEARAAGQPVRKDDTPEVFEVRLREYYKNTAPLIGYYWATRDLVQVDGMAGMQTVAEAIAKVLDKA